MNKEIAFEIEDEGVSYNPDFIAHDPLERSKAAAWYVKDDPLDGDEGIYVAYALDIEPTLRRGFTLNLNQALSLIDDLHKAVDAFCEIPEDQSAAQSS